MKPRLNFIIGCTACGKSAVAFQLAKRIGAEIVVVDSMKVYRRMDLGTGKPATERRAEVPYHMIDIVEPSEEFSVARYCEQASLAIADVHARGRPILMVGGTSLYIMGLNHGLLESRGDDPEFRARLRARADHEGNEPLHAELRKVDPDAAERIHLNDYRRIERALEVHHLTGVPISQLQTQWASSEGDFDCRFIGLRRELMDQNHRINNRARKMMQAGLLDEVRALVAEDRPLSTQASQAVGYAELIRHLRGELSLEDAFEQVKIHSRRLGKSQRTWSKRFRGVEWFDLEVDEDADTIANRILDRVSFE
ncbi:MAG: tRNA (adenosine(37)-N6)-dimethylallyltransferase MiaA [Planctomycetota bacterium]|nr:tRNA (adenosine(37)-N6)-dimethylallyltransferase MiaA [Planctomycetota bacterium]